MANRRFPMTQLSMYGDQWTELVAQMRGVTLADGDGDVVCLSYFADGSVVATVDGNDQVWLEVPCDVPPSADAGAWTAKRGRYVHQRGCGAGPDEQCSCEPPFPKPKERK